MRRRRDWIVVAIVAVLLAAGVVLAGTLVPGATGKATAAGSSPSPWPSPSPGVILQVGHDGTFVKQFTLADLEALTPFPGASLPSYAGFMNSGGVVSGPELVTGDRVSDIVQAALGTPLTATQSVAVIGSDGYSQIYTYDQLVKLIGLSQMYNANTQKPVSLSSVTGPFAAVLIYSDPGQNVMATADGPLRLVVADATNEPIVMTGSDSVKWVAKLNVLDSVAKNWSLKLTGLKIKGKRQTRTITRNDFQSCVNCHGSSYKAAGKTWSGTPLDLFVGEVDGGATMDYNAALAHKGYRIRLTSTTGKVRYVSSRTIIDKRRIVLAWELNGAVLRNNLFPLRLMGPKLTASQKLGRIKSVT
ncbi:MAG: hypothetical protein ABR941_10950, partial [Thermoleophilia bacterium]